MSQMLDLGQGNYIHIDRLWRNGGKEPVWNWQNGVKVLIEKGTNATPEIAQIGNEFYYKMWPLTPVSNPVHVDWLPEPFKTTALAFIEKAAGKKPKIIISSVKIAGQEDSVEEQQPKKRGRKKKDSSYIITGATKVKPTRSVDIDDFLKQGTDLDKIQ